MFAHVDHLVPDFDGNVEAAVKENEELILDVGYLQLNGGMLTYHDLYAASQGIDTPLMREYLLGMHKAMGRYNHPPETNFDYIADIANQADQVYLTGYMLNEYYDFTNTGNQDNAEPIPADYPQH